MSRREVRAGPFYRAGGWAKKYFLTHDAPLFLAIHAHAHALVIPTEVLRVCGKNALNQLIWRYIIIRYPFSYPTALF